MDFQIFYWILTNKHIFSEVSAMKSIGNVERSDFIGVSGGAEPPPSDLNVFLVVFFSVKGVFNGSFTGCFTICFRYIFFT